MKSPALCLSRSHYTVLPCAAGCLDGVCTGALPTKIFLRGDAGNVRAVIHGQLCHRTQHGEREQSLAEVCPRFCLFVCSLRFLAPRGLSLLYLCRLYIMLSRFCSSSSFSVQYCIARGCCSLLFEYCSPALARILYSMLLHCDDRRPSTTMFEAYFGNRH